MLFDDYDPAKSEANKVKHGIDFEEAKELWNDAKAIETKTPYRPEERFIRIDSIGAKIWAAVFTYRDGKVRLISVRRARRIERKRYQEASSDS